MKYELIRKGLVLGIILLFVEASFLSSLGGTIVEKTTSIDSKSSSYIQDLIDNASDGDTINIPSGTYYENILINKSINLVGEDKINTVIDGNYSGDSINIKANNVKIKNFTIIHGNSSGITLQYNVGCVITGNIISKNRYGIHLYESNRNIMYGNTISLNNGEGIILVSSDFNIIKGNIVKDNRRGIYIRYRLIGGFPQVHMYKSSQLNIIKSNNISNNTDGVYIDISVFNFIMKNNFIENNRDAFFISYPYARNRWLQNYWNESLILPKLIIGEKVLGNPPWEQGFNIDWLPAKKPYDEISEAEHASVVAKVENSKIKIILTTGGQNYPSTGYSFANSVTIRLNGTALAENDLEGNTGWEVGESLFIGGSTPTLDDEESAIGPLGPGSYSITVTIIETVVFDDSITIV